MKLEIGSSKEFKEILNLAQNVVSDDFSKSSEVSVILGETTLAEVYWDLDSSTNEEYVNTWYHKKVLDTLGIQY